MARTINPRYRILLGLFVVAIHMFFLLYLHFAYHELAESMFLIINSNLNVILFIYLAVSHALNNEVTISVDLPMNPVLPVASQSVNIISQTKSNFTLTR